MFDFIKENIPEELRRLFVFSRSVNLYETSSSQMFHIPKGKTLRFSLNTLIIMMALNYGVSFSMRFCTNKLT